MRDSEALLVEVAVREWFIIYSTAYHIAIFTDIMDNSTGYSNLSKSLDCHPGA